MATPVASDFRSEDSRARSRAPGRLAAANSRARLANSLEIVLVESHTIPKFTGELFFRSGNAAASSFDARPRQPRLRGRAHRNIQAQQPSDRRGFAPHGRGSFVRRRDGHERDFVRGPLGFFRRRAASRCGARDASHVSRGRIRARTPATSRRRAHRTHALPVFSPASECEEFLFGAHPYAAISPSEAQVEAFRREQLVEFYEQNYRPENALFIAVGDFQPDAMLAQVERVFGGWSGAKPAPFADAPLPELRGRRVYFVHLPGAVQAQVVAGNRAITRQSPDWLRYTLANSIYGGAFNSRLVMNIREQKGTRTVRAAAFTRCGARVTSRCPRRCATKSSPRR